MIGWMPHDHTGNAVSIYTMAEWIFREESSESVDRDEFTIVLRQNA